MPVSAVYFGDRGKLFELVHLRFSVPFPPCNTWKNRGAGLRQGKDPVERWAQDLRRDRLIFGHRGLPPAPKRVTCVWKEAPFAFNGVETDQGENKQRVAVYGFSHSCMWRSVKFSKNSRAKILAQKHISTLPAPRPNFDFPVPGHEKVGTFWWGLYKPQIGMVVHWRYSYLGRRQRPCENQDKAKSGRRL